MTPAQRLNKIISLYNKGAKSADSDVLTYMIQVLIYINTNMVFYKNHSLSNIAEDFVLLQNALEAFNTYLSRDNIDRDNDLVKSFIFELVNNLIFLNDLLLSQPLSRDYRPYILEIIEGLLLQYSTQDFWIYFRVYKNSETIEYLRLRDKLIDVEDGWNVEKLIEDEYFGTFNQKINLQLLVFDDFKKLPQLFEIIIQLQIQCQCRQSSHSIQCLPDALKDLAKKYSNQERFVAIFLSVYVDMYNTFSQRRIYSMPIFLMILSSFFPILDGLLSPNRFSQILNALTQVKTDFLANPGIAEMEIIYKAYEAIMFCYIDLPKKVYRDDDIIDPNVISTVFFFIWPHLQIAGRNTVESLQLASSSSILNKLPALMQHYLIQAFQDNQKLQTEFEALLILFERVNSQATTYQQRHLGLFFSQHQDVVMQIVNVMGVEGVNYLRSLLAVTVLNLERTLSAMYTLPEELQEAIKDYFVQRHPLHNSEEFKSIIICMNILGLLIHTNNYDEVRDIVLSPDVAPNYYMTRLTNILIGKVLKQDELLTEEQIDEMFKRISTSKLVNLIAATTKMSNSQYREVYINLLKIDLIGGNFNDFLHNKGQANIIGKRLANHNDRIRLKLQYFGINPDLALSYQRRLNFSVSINNNHESNLNLLYTIMLTYVHELKNELEQMSFAESTSELNKLQSYIEQLQQPLEINKKSRRALGEINVILSQLSHSGFSDKFNEFSEHVRVQYKLIKEFKQSSRAKKRYNFHVEQWNKASIDTFFLGDEVGCCLATTNGQFAAMVQRRMDDAMLFHVAVDEETHKPVALIWLYLAQTNDRKVVLVANFFEVNSKYATNITLRTALLNGLLLFTKQYCQDNPQIANFYMNTLSYGWNIDDLNNYAIEQVRLLDKIGGPFIPSSSEEMVDAITETVSSYYLVSLTKDRFHKFDATHLDLTNIVITEDPQTNHQTVTNSGVGLFSPQSGEDTPEQSGINYRIE